MIYFDNWELCADAILARQHDHLSRRLEIRGELPSGWNWDALIQVGAAMDVISLESMPGGVGANLSRDQLSVGGRFYMLQLRGRKGDVVRHTNVVQVYVPASLSGDGQWPTVPSEFTQMEQRMQEISGHPPVPGSSFWKIWDVDSHSYVDSEFPLPTGGTSVALDPTLTAEDKAAQAKAVGEAIARIEEKAQLTVTGAQVGQIIKVKQIDGDGTPTEWEPADIPTRLPNPEPLVINGTVYDGSMGIGVVTDPQLSVASKTTLGGVKAERATEKDTTPVRINNYGFLAVTVPTPGEIAAEVMDILPRWEGGEY